MGSGHVKAVSDLCKSNRFLWPPGSASHWSGLGREWSSEDRRFEASSLDLQLLVGLGACRGLTPVWCKRKVSGERLTRDFRTTDFLLLLLGPREACVNGPWGVHGRV